VVLWWGVVCGSGWLLCGCEQWDLNICFFKNYSFVSLSIIGVFVIYDADKHINISQYCEAPIILSITNEI
jgi:hypothetical protein